VTLPVVTGMRSRDVMEDPLLSQWSEL